MPYPDDIPVYLPREDWEKINAALQLNSGLTPLATRLGDAVDAALSERIDRKVAEFMGESEGA